MTVKDLLRSDIYFNSSVKFIKFINEGYILNLCFNYNCRESVLDKYGKYDMDIYKGYSRILDKTHLEDKL